MSDHYTQPSRLTRAGYRYVYDPLRAGYLKGLVASLGLSGSESVLDFGSGAGSEAFYLARALDRGRLTCLDVSAAWLEEARRRLARFQNVTFLLSPASEAGLQEASFDLILAHYVLHDVDPASLPGSLKALARSLRPGGRLVAVEPVGRHHGLSAVELAELMGSVGLVERSREVVRPPFESATQSVFERA
jgi:ubiquinone/menaquinone biosynthesis C-methylase UbiE